MLAEGSSRRHAAALAGLDTRQAADAADVLVLAGVLVGVQPLQFAHALIREAVYAEIPPGRRSELHRVASTLLHGDDAPLDDVVAHVMLTHPAGDCGAVAILERAARRAADLGAPDAAARFLRRALEEPAPAEQRPGLRLNLGVAEYRAGHPDAAVDSLRMSLNSLTARSMRARAAVALAEALGMGQRRWEEAAAVAEQELAQRPDRTHDDALRLEGQALLYRSVAEGSTKLERLEPAVAAITAPGPGAAAILGMYAYDLGLQLQGDVDQVTSIALRALEYDPDQVDALATLVSAGRIDLVRPRLEAHRAGLAAAGEIPSVVRADRILSCCEMCDGQLDRAEERLWRARAAGGSSAWITSMLADLIIERGDVKRALELLDRDGLAGDPDAARAQLAHPAAAAFLFVVRGRLAISRGDLVAAERELCRAPIAEYVNPSFDNAWRSPLIEVLLGTGRRDEALLLADQTAQSARAFGAPSALGSALVDVARCQPTGDAVEQLSLALPLLSQGQDRIAELKGILALGETLRRVGRRRDARGYLARARALAAQYGSPGIAQRASAELLAAGGKPRRVALDGPESLTPSERRVCELAAGGMSNREIAATLVITMATVATHLTHAYSKLEIQGRADLTRALDDPPPMPRT